MQAREATWLVTGEGGSLDDLAGATPELVDHGGGLPGRAPLVARDGRHDRDEPVRRLRHLRRRIAGSRPVRLARSSVGLRVPPAPPPAPRPALASAEVDGSTDPALLPDLDRAIAVRPVRRLLRRRALALSTAGELTAAAAAWRDLERRGDPKAALRARLIDGRLRETDPTWLPRIEGHRSRSSPRAAPGSSTSPRARCPSAGPGSRSARCRTSVPSAMPDSSPSSSPRSVGRGSPG